MTKNRHLDQPQLVEANSAAHVSHLESQLEQAADQLKAMEDYVKGEERLSQLRAWAIDRAVSIYQINRSADKSPDWNDVRTLAEQIVSYANHDYQDLVNAKQPETVQ